ncbi:MAG TPA: hypothetical protein VLE27_15590, partial [Thermoanaerobaculia bacterium]|nr:hypothetical protein [Thermoanaerobaculia bacterium]
GLATSLEANTADLQHLEAHRARLAELLNRAQALSSQQAALTASKQEVSKELLGVIAEGRKLATFLRVGVRQHYGTRAEKLVEFGLQPFRGRRRPAAAEPPVEEKKSAPSPG